MKTIQSNQTFGFKYITNTCRILVTRFYFWISVAICSLLEPFLCAVYPTNPVLYAQLVILFLSTALFIIQTIGEMTNDWQAIISQKPDNRSIWYEVVVSFICKGRNVVEFVCLTTGLIFIWYRPGIAALRCFRLFRLLWFHENSRVKNGAMKRFSPYTGDEFLIRLFAVMQFAIGALTALGNEMFRFTNKTKGGLILMLVFFYSAFVFGAALWVDTGTEMKACATLGSCMYTMMRLTFFDGSGFDYAYDLSTQGHKWLFCLVMIYMCVTAFGILNGLVGLFGTAFNEASLAAFDGNEEYMQSEMGSQRNNSSRNLTSASSVTGSVLSINTSNLPSNNGNNNNNGNGNHNGNNNTGGGSQDLNDLSSFPPTPNSLTGLLSHSADDKDIESDNEKDPSASTPCDIESGTLHQRIKRDSYSMASAHSDSDVVEATAKQRDRARVSKDSKSSPSPPGGLYGQFKRQASRQRKPPTNFLAGPVPPAPITVVSTVNDSLTEARFRTLNDSMLRLLQMQARMEHEIHRLCEFSGLEVDPQFKDDVKMTLAKTSILPINNRPLNVRRANTRRSSITFKKESPLRFVAPSLLSGGVNSSNARSMYSMTGGPNSSTSLYNHRSLSNRSGDGDVALNDDNVGEEEENKIDDVYETTSNGKEKNDLSDKDDNSIVEE